MNIGEKISVLRQIQRLSQEGLAEKLHVSRQSVSKWESGKNAPDLSILLKISDLFGVTTDELLRDELPLSQMGIEPLFRPKESVNEKLKYFGTDGFRGEANETLTALNAFKIGRFLGWYYSSSLCGRNESYKTRVAVGKDTRLSSYMFEYALAAGLTASGADAYMLHVTTTPSVSYVVRQDGFDCGVMISASHNPYFDNGIKLVNSSGEKMDDHTLSLVEKYIDGDISAFDVENDLPLAKREKIGKIVDWAAGRNRYVGFLISVAANSYKELDVALDCANGASWSIAKSVFGALGARVHVINDEPDGMNINFKAGSTNVTSLKKFVREHHCSAGFAFDGDADRCIAVDENGNELNGDHTVYIIAQMLRKHGLLKNNTVVSTVMSNLGFFKALDEAGIKCIQTTVGDKFVHDAMIENDCSIGGEQTGHTIIRKYATTGDGILTAIMLTECMMESKRPLSELASPVRMFPQTVRNVCVKNKSEAANDKYVLALVEKERRALGSDGRVILRESGTEPVVRIMTEAPTQKICDEVASRIASAIEERGHSKNPK